MALTVGIDQQNARVSSSSTTKESGNPERDGVADVDFPTLPLWLVSPKTRVIA